MTLQRWESGEVKEGGVGSRSRIQYARDDSASLQKMDAWRTAVLPAQLPLVSGTAVMSQKHHWQTQPFQRASELQFGRFKLLSAEEEMDVQRRTKGVKEAAEKTAKNLAKD